MEASGSSRYLAAIQETILSDEDSDHLFCCGQWTIALMNLPQLALG